MECHGRKPPHSPVTFTACVVPILVNHSSSCYYPKALYICLFQNIIFAFVPEDDFGIKLKASKKLKKCSF